MKKKKAALLPLQRKIILNLPFSKPFFSKVWWLLISSNLSFVEIKTPFEDAMKIALFCISVYVYVISYGVFFFFFKMLNK